MTQFLPACILLTVIFAVWAAAWFMLPARKVKIMSGENIIYGRFYGKPSAGRLKPAVVFFHGWKIGGGSRTVSDALAGFCARLFDCICLTAAFRGMGSPGDINTLTRQDYLADVIAVYDFLAACAGVDKENISAAGESFGSYMAAILSSKRTVKNLILRVPTDFPAAGFSDVPQIKTSGMNSIEWKRQAHEPEESPALKAISGFKNNLFIIASQKDEFVPFATTQNYLNAAKSGAKLEYVMMKNTPHLLSNPGSLFKFMNLIFKYMDKTI